MLPAWLSFVVGTTILLALQISGAQAFWRLLCDGSVGLARIDPLTNVGHASDHVHSIKGGSAFSPDSRSAELADSACSSCNVKEDNSAYWSPALYFLNSDDGTVEVVPEKPPHKSYYFLNSGSTSDGQPQKIEAFPKGFQMISGSNLNRNSSLPDPDPNPLGPWPQESQELRAQRALGFNCLNYARGSLEGSLSRHSMPEKAYLDENCADGIRLELMFPSCWDGELDGKDHKSHVAFPDGVMVGNCPEGYDRRLVSLFFETIVATDMFKGKNGKFVFSNGDPTGFGYHGDFIEAWAPGVLQKAVDECTNPSGRMEDCPVFTFNSNPSSCELEKAAIPAEIASENVKGPMKGLPNRIQVQSGPEPALPPAGSGSGAGAAGKEAQASKALNGNVETAPPVIAKVPVVPVSDSPAPRPSQPLAEYYGAANLIADVQPSQASDSPSTKIAKTTLSTATSVFVPAPPPAPTSFLDERPVVVAQEGRVVATSLWRSGREAHEVIVVLEEVTVTTKATATATATAAPLDKRQHQHHHHHQHAARSIGGRKMR